MNDYAQDKLHLHKLLSRTEIFLPLGGKPAKKILLLPAGTCLDIKRGMELGVITRETELHLFEQKPSVMKNIKAFCREHGLNARYLQGNVLNYTLANDYDMIYLDFCGELTGDILEFIETNRKVLNKTPVAFTFSVIYRNNSLYNSMQEDECPVAPFALPATAQVLTNESLNQKAYWTTGNVLESIGCRKVEFYRVYKEDGHAVPMVFFMANTDKISPAEKAWKTRKLQELQEAYDQQTSAGMKAAIKRQMNLL